MSNMLLESAKDAGRSMEFIAGYITALEQRIRTLETIMVPPNVDTTIVDRLLQIEQRLDEVDKTIDSTVDGSIYHYFNNNKFKLEAY